MTSNPNVNGIINLVARIREQANLFIEAELRGLGIEGILPAHGSILYFLFQQNQPVAMKAIVEKVGRVKSTVTGMINTLEQRGFVEKFQSPEDGRVMLVQLTDQGRELEPAMKAVSEKLMTKVYGDMPMEDRVGLTESLALILNNLKNG